MSPTDRGVKVTKRNQELIDDAKDRIQKICDAHTGQHLFEGGSGVSCWVSAVVRVRRRDLWVPYAAYGNGLQLGFGFTEAMAAAGFKQFEVELD
jgi:hypothetical protein